MVLYIIRRLVSIAVTFFVVSVIVFLMMHAIPGGPFDGHDMPLSEAVRAKLMARLGLDQPLWVQYVNYMSGVLRLDFGIPFQSPGETVLSLLANACAAEPDPRRRWCPHRGTHSAFSSAGPPRSAATAGSTTSPRRRYARTDRAGLRHLDAVDPRLRRPGSMAAASGWGKPDAGSFRL